MGLNIKDPEAHKLAQQLADETGQTMTRAVTEALRETLDRVRKKKSKKMTVEEMLEIGRQFRRHLKAPARPCGTSIRREGLPK